MHSRIPESFHRQIRRAQAGNDRVHEPVIGIVVDIKDPEKLARIKVKFPTLPGSDTSTWAPLSAVGAGKDRGLCVLPEIEDEVLVVFEHGDITRPVILGALWNGKDKPPDKNDGKNERRSITSRSGARIIFDDDAGTLTLESADKKSRVVLDKANKITFEAQSGDVCIQAPQGTLEVVANEVALNASQACHLESLGGLALEGKSKVTIGGQMLQVHAQEIGLNSKAPAAPEKAQDKSEAVPDPLE